MRFIIILLPLVLFAACHRAEKNAVVPVHIATWAATGAERPAQITMPPLEAVPPQSAVPWAGTVSHHLLAGAVIEAWFAQLAERNPGIRTFFLLSPSHYGLSTQTWSLAECVWDCGGKTVCTDSAAERVLAERLGVPYDEQVFPNEHGINTLIPYIAQYFPQAQVCPIAVHGEPPLDQAQAQRLADALAPYFDSAGKRQNFLLISTDFAHHGDLAGTEFKDARSRRFFAQPSRDTWIFCGCDNRPGVYTLSRFVQDGTHAAVLYHTNSYALSGGMDADDITSYFFSFLY